MTQRISNTVSNESINRIVQIESAGNPRAHAPTSSAQGLGQFIDATWISTIRIHRPDLFNGPPYGDELALEKDPSLQLEMLARFTEDNARALGAGWQDGDLYLAHFLGVGAAKKVMRASQSARVEPIVGDAAVRANRSILSGKNCGQVRAWAQTSMVNRWDRAGKTDWVAKYWKGTEPIAALSTDDVTLSPPEEPVLQPAVPPPVTPSASGGDVLLSVKKRLKAMHYSPGGLTSDWGGMTAGALAGFINDRNMGIPSPTSLDMFQGEADAIVRELAIAEGEDFVRPVSDERANLDKKKVEETAPEAAPVRRNFLLTLWGSIVTAGGAAWNSVSSYVTEAWQFFTDHKDDVPEDLKTNAFSWLSNIPVGAWIGLAAAVLGFIAYNSWNGLKSIEKSVQTGERQ